MGCLAPNLAFLIVIWAFRLGLIRDAKTEYQILGVLVAITGNVQSGILSFLLFFVAGMAILWTVDEKKWMEEKQKPVL